MAPTADRLQAARTLYAEGNFTAALAAAEASAPTSRHDIEERECLIAECLLYRGDFEQARSRAESAFGRELTAAHTARYWEVIGRIRLDLLQRASAAEAFRKAVRAAERCTDLKILASAQQGWLITMGENLGAGLSAAVREAYQTAVRSADGAVLAGFHLRVARLEGQRGQFAQALHHLSLAKSLLDRCPNTALTALYHVNRSCVLALAGSYDEARKSAETGSLLAEKVGHLRLSMAASANVAYIAISAGELSVAESWLRKARKTATDLGIVEMGLLDSLATLALIQGDLRKAETYLAECRQSVQKQELKWLTMTEALALFTELHLHKKSGDREHYVRTLAKIRAASDALNDRHSQHFVALLESESLFDNAAYQRARELLCKSLRRAPEHTVYRAEQSRMLARDLWLDGRRASAKRRLLRATATAMLRGSRLSWAECLRETLSINAREPYEIAYSLEHQEQLGRTRFAALLETPSRSWFQDVAPTEQLSRDPLDGFDDAVGILETLDEPELKGREALATVIALGVIEAGAVARRTDSGLRLVAAYKWAKPPFDQDLSADDTIVKIDLGEADSCTFQLFLKARAEVRATVVVAGVRRLLEASKALEASRKEQQGIASLWQAEFVVDEPGAVFSSAQMIELMQTARKVSTTTLPVLLLGKTGTGKEVLARAIHRASPRSSKVFLPFNCSSVPRDMIESQLFGFKKGAFTGAHEDSLGIIRSAEGGTLFLDEIGELPPEIQPKLLRFLEANEIHPLGEGVPLKVDVRIIAATNANLEDLIDLKQFREDLYYRLNIVRFVMPTLADRREEIPHLIMHLLARFQAEEKKSNIKISDELMEYMLLYKWPGNIRQLYNELRRMVAMASSGDTLRPEHLSTTIRSTRKTVSSDEPAAIASPPPAEPPPPDPNSLTLQLDRPLPEAVEELERAMIEHAIARANGRMEEAARLLGISRKGLFLKRRRWGNGEEPPPTES